jgi:hypothetical protein
MSDDGRIMQIIPRNGSVCTGAVLAAVASGCVRRLPPAPPPEPLVPQVASAGPPADGSSRLIIDVVEAPVPVQRVDMAAEPTDNGRGRTTYKFVERPGTLCDPSPCATDVQAGTNLLLGFPVIGKDALEIELVHVGPESSVYRRSLSIYEDKTGGTRLFGILATSFGGAAAMTGAALLPIGLAESSTPMTVAGGISLGVGSVLLALGIWAINADAPTFRPGSVSHFPLAR